MKQVLHGAFQLSLQPEDAALKQGGALIEENKIKPGFVKASLEILVDPEISDNVRVAAACSLKEHVVRSYELDNDGEEGFLLPQEDRTLLKDYVFEVFSRIKKHRSMRKTFQETIKKIVEIDFPDNWPNIAQTVLNSLASCSDFDALQNSLIVLSILVDFFDCSFQSMNSKLKRSESL